VADAALIPTPQVVSRVQSANIFRLLLVIGFFPFLFSVCRSLQTIARSITSNAKRTPKPTLAARVELAPTGPTRLNPPTFVILSPSSPWRVALIALADCEPRAAPLRNASLVAPCFPVSPQSKSEILYGQCGSEKQLTWPYNGLITVVSGVIGHHDVLSASPPSLAAHFLPAGNFRPEL
jgi:hypothetical protein